MGSKCHFPFIYKNKIYNSCIDSDPLDDGTSAKICSTTDNFDRLQKIKY